MTDFTRRTLVQGGTAACRGRRAHRPGAAGMGESLGASRPWKPRRARKLTLLRWKYFVQAEDDAFIALVDAFTKATGVKVTVVKRVLEDVQPKASVAANTGAGPDMFWGLYSLPHLFPA